MDEVIYLIVRHVKEFCMEVVIEFVSILGLLRYMVYIYSVVCVIFENTI
jgi:hypothetical protein